MDNLHYRGDCTDIDPNRLLGPDLHGAFYLPVAARFSQATGTTTVAVKPVPPAELDEHFDALNHEATERHRIRNLFMEGPPQ